MLPSASGEISVKCFITFSHPVYVVCMYVCMYAPMHVCIYICIYISVCIYNINVTLMNVKILSRLKTWERVTTPHATPD